MGAFIVSVNLDEEILAIISLNLGVNFILEMLDNFIMKKKKKRTFFVSVSGACTSEMDGAGIIDTQTLHHQV